MGDQEREIRARWHEPDPQDEDEYEDMQFILSLLDQDRARWRAHRAICEVRVNNMLELRAAQAQIAELTAALEIIAYRGATAVAAHNSSAGIPVTVGAIRSFARRVLDKR